MLNKIEVCHVKCVAQVDHANNNVDIHGKQWSQAYKKNTCLQSASYLKFVYSRKILIHSSSSVMVNQTFHYQLNYSSNKLMSSKKDNIAIRMPTYCLPLVKKVYRMIPSNYKAC